MQHVIRRSGSRLRSQQHVRPLTTNPQTKPAELANLPATILSEDGSYTLRVRKHGNKALPLPALLDPVKLATRTKYKAPKQPANFEPSKLTPFQQELQGNPYARALATPIRQCVLTRAHLPSAFLIPFVSNLPAISAHSSTQALQPTLQPRISFRSRSPSSYILARSSAFQNIAPSGKGKKNGRKWAVLVNQRMAKAWAERIRVDPKKVEVGKEWRWDERMEETVRRMLVGDVVKKLRWCAAQEGETLVGTVDEVGEGSIAVVLLLGGDGGKVVVDDGVARYDLKTMSDQEELQAVREMCGLGESDVLAVKRDQKTVLTLLALEALRAYNGEEVSVDGSREPPSE